MTRREVVVNDKMQQNFVYFLTEKPGTNFHAGFQPELTPKEMLALGVFGGKYMTDCTGEFPDDWFEHAKLCPERHDPELNFFHIEASLPLSVWRAKGWIREEDPRGWFQWYCRYYMGRRCSDDERQILWGRHDDCSEAGQTEQRGDIDNSCSEFKKSIKIIAGVSADIQWRSC